ncbi:MAG: hypothetical protein RMK61_01655 [Bacteroidota bacterium]|nr:hypothetical protein [Bacteroidota bacterium]MDW8137140.1 hypothetical protein [Bacteroidota bacterium]
MGLILASSAEAQPQRAELWPYPHLVYRWLERAYGRGVLAVRGEEAPPVARAQLLERLLAVDTLRLGRRDRALWRSWVRELRDEPAQEATLFKPGFCSTALERHLYTYRDEQTRFFLDLSLGAELMRAFEGARYMGPVSRLGGRVYGSVFGRVGFFLDARAIGYRPAELGRFDPVWSRTQNASILEEGSYDVQAFINYHATPVELELGRGRLLYGSEPESSLLWSDNPPYVPYLRLRLAYPRLQFHFLHAALSERAIEVPLPEDPSRTGSLKRPRWLALHRVQSEPLPGWIWAFTEAVVYGNRGMELAYWVPLYPFLISEDEFGFLDNVLWTLETRVRLKGGLLLHGTWLIDNLTFSGLFTDTLDNKHAFQVGFRWYGPAGWEAGCSYTYVDPFVYSHPTPYNAYRERQWGIGHPAGPNADSWRATLTRWLPGRGHLEFSISHVRKGLNVLDAQGRLIRNVGGDLLEGSGSLSEGKKRFLVLSDLHRWLELSLALRWEPWRAFVLWFRWERRHILEGNRIPERTLWRLGLEVGR